MKKLVRWLFKHRRKEMEDLFIEDLIGDVPKEVSENALHFLVSGKKQLDPWLRWEAYVLQRKMIRPLKGSEGYVGALVFIQTLATIMNRLEQTKRLFPVDEHGVPKNTAEESLRGVDEFFQNQRSDTPQT